MTMNKGLAYIDGNSLSIEQLDDIIRLNLSIDLTESAWEKVARSRGIIEEIIADPTKVVYGITTGFGSFANVSISQQFRKQLQINLVRSHAVGVGEPISVDTVRRMLILRINTLSKGRSGIQLENLRLMVKACNSNFNPRIPCQGTVGASGDLAPLSHLALGLMGEGEAYDHESQSYRPAAEVQAKLGLTKITLTEKEGLALINGTQFMSAIISKVASQIEKLVSSSIALYALAVESFGIDLSLFSEQSQLFYSQFNSELGEVIRDIRHLLGSEQSQLHKKTAHSQQVHSLMDFPEALAGVLKTIRTARRMIEEEMNSATDNPLVYYKQEGVEKAELVSAGNFHGEYVAKAADFLGFALFDLAKFSEARIQKYINGKVSRLPPYLIKNGGLNSGLMILQYTTASLLSESKVLVKPASADSIVTSAGQEDHVSMGGFATRKCSMLCANVSHILGIELLMSSTAVNILQLQPSVRVGSILSVMGKSVSPILEDRYYGPDIQEATRLVSFNLQAL